MYLLSSASVVCIYGVLFRGDEPCIDLSKDCVSDALSPCQYSDIRHLTSYFIVAISTPAVVPTGWVKEK